MWFGTTGSTACWAFWCGRKSCPLASATSRNGMKQGWFDHVQPSWTQILPADFPIFPTQLGFSSWFSSVKNPWFFSLLSEERHQDAAEFELHVARYPSQRFAGRCPLDGGWRVAPWGINHGKAAFWVADSIIGLKWRNSSGWNTVLFKCHPRLGPRCEPWCWYIYLQNWLIFRVNVGKYSSTMAGIFDLNKVVNYWSASHAGAWHP